MDVELTEEESSALQQALHTYVSDLRSEISHTDDRDFRNDLKAKRDLLDAIMAKLSGAHDGSETRDGEGRSVVRVVSLWWAELPS